MMYIKRFLIILFICIGLFCSHDSKSHVQKATELDIVYMNLLHTLVSYACIYITKEMTLHIFNCH